MGNQNNLQKKSISSLHHPSTRPNNIGQKSTKTVSDSYSNKNNQYQQFKNYLNGIKPSDVGQSIETTLVNYEDKINKRLQNQNILDFQNIILQYSSQLKENQVVNTLDVGSKEIQKNSQIFSAKQKILQRIQCQNGIIYQGEIIAKNKQGLGKQIWPDGSIYIGQWKKNVPHGKGILKHSTSEFFEGTWKEGKVQGYGAYSLNCQVLYQGYWKNDKKHGKGKEIYLDKSIYEGNFLRGMRHGNGILKLSDGSIYEGEFKRNQFYGHGKFIWPCSKIYCGQWKNGRFNGNGKLIWSNGNIYQGQYLNDQRNGIGAFYDKKSDKCYSGVWVMGKLLEIKTVNNKNSIAIS